MEKEEEEIEKELRKAEELNMEAELVLKRARGLFA